MIVRKTIVYIFLVTFLLPGAIFAQTMSLDTTGYLADFRSKWINAAAYTLEVAEAMPAQAYDYRPTLDQMSFREQLLHMAKNIQWLSADHLGGVKTEQEIKDSSLSKTKTIALLRKELESAALLLFQLDPETLDEEVEFFAGPMSRRKVLMLMNDHMTHHRGQLVVYLRLNGIVPPSYRGW